MDIAEFVGRGLGKTLGQRTLLLVKDVDDKSVGLCNGRMAGGYFFDADEDHRRHERDGTKGRHRDAIGVAFAVAGRDDGNARWKTRECVTKFVFGDCHCQSAIYIILSGVGKIRRLADRASMADNRQAMTSIEEFFAGVRSDVDAALEQLVPAADIEPTRLHEAIRWSLFGGGKRIRPALLIATGETFGAEAEQLISTAAAIEMVHTYSLIHDDLPSMDNDDLRRGRATCHRQFDVATAILAGDVLQTLAFKTIAEDHRLPAEKRILLVNLLADAAGTPRGMVAGQQLDLDAEGSVPTVDAIEGIYRRKTGALISAAVAAGAMIADASIPELDALAEYAAYLGILFQMTDDLLDVTEETATLGKTAGKDAAAKKATFPALLGIDATREVASKSRQQAISALEPIKRDTTLLSIIVTAIADRKQ
jgi:geranylgeranyl pyrophosphate synthase